MSSPALMDLPPPAPGLAFPLTMPHTPPPYQAWTMQVARNVTMESWGVVSAGQYRIHDRDGQYGSALQQLTDAAGVKRVSPPPRSPNLNAYAERWVRSVKEECLSRVI